MASSLRCAMGWGCTYMFSSSSSTMVGRISTLPVCNSRKCMVGGGVGGMYGDKIVEWRVGEIYARVRRHHTAMVTSHDDDSDNRGSVDTSRGQ